MHEILSLGAGVQSTAVLLMSCLGDLPKLDMAIFSDTGWEPKGVYRHLEWLERFSEEHGIPVHRVQTGNIRDDATISQKSNGERHGSNGRWGSMPYFILNADGSKGMVRRQCTAEYKIEPIAKFIKSEVLGLKRRGHWPKSPVVRHWFGISFDEPERMRFPVQVKKVQIGTDLFGEPMFGKQESPIRWVTNYYPLCSLELTGEKSRIRHPQTKMDRSDCEDWLRSHGFKVPPRSACIGCPFHSDEEWIDMNLNRPDEFADACEFDELMRETAGMGGKMFLHRSCVPLAEVEFNARDTEGVAANECLGMCGN